MKEQMVFKRYETKFMLTRCQCEELEPFLREHMLDDAHKNSRICNIYFDTPDYRLIRRSLEKPIFKEKLRLRGYGSPRENDLCFVEIKRKFKHVVFKRRIALTEEQAMRALGGEIDLPQCQIGQEIEYMLNYYEQLRPMLYLSYERRAMYDAFDPTLRLTLDDNILWRNEDLRLSKGCFGSPLLSEDQVLMEVKSSGAIPLWLISWLSERKIYKQPFSKYGTVYTKHLLQRGEKNGNIQ